MEDSKEKSYWSRRYIGVVAFLILELLLMSLIPNLL